MIVLVSHGHMIKSKFEVFNFFFNFCCLVQIQFGKNIKRIVSDNSTEYELSKFFSRDGTLHQLRCVNTP